MATLAGAACGKVILLGEHAVVYGHPALCGALRAGVEIDAEPGAGALVVPAWGVRTPPCERLEDACDGAGPALPRAYAAVLTSLGVERGRLAHDLHVRFAIPTGAGLGSSAALAVAVARALGHVLGVALTQAQIAAAALAAEEVFHGRPSGLDHTVAQHGGFGLFRRGAGLQPLAAPALGLCIGQSGRPRDTRGRVARVAELHEQRPGETRADFARVAALVEAAAAAVGRGDLRAVGEAMNENQALLERLDVSCPEIEEMCRLARGAGAYGAKLTGGGGGGCVIALAPGGEAAVQAAWRRGGFDSFLTAVGGAEEMAA